MKIAFSLLVVLCLTSCGGGGGTTTPSPPVIPPVTPPVTPTGPITGVAVTVIATDAVGNSTHQCHATNVTRTDTTFSEIFSYFLYILGLHADKNSRQ